MDEMDVADKHSWTYQEIACLKQVMMTTEVAEPDILVSIAKSELLEMNSVKSRKDVETMIFEIQDVKQQEAAYNIALRIFAGEESSDLEDLEPQSPHTETKDTNSPIKKRNDSTVLIWNDDMVTEMLHIILHSTHLRKEFSGKAIHLTMCEIVKNQLIEKYECHSLTSKQVHSKFKKLKASYNKLNGPEEVDKFPYFSLMSEIMTNAEGMTRQGEPPVKKVRSNNGSSETTVKYKRYTEDWEVDEVKLLISVMDSEKFMRTRDEKTKRDKCKFEDLAGDGKLVGLQKTPEQIKTKFQQLKTSYNYARNKLDTSGEDSNVDEICPYYNELYDVFGVRPMYSLRGIDSDGLLDETPEVKDSFQIPNNGSIPVLAKQDKKSEMKSKNKRSREIDGSVAAANEHALLAFAKARADSDEINTKTLVAGIKDSLLSFATALNNGRQQ